MCVSLEEGVVCGESSCDQSPDAAVMEQQMAYREPEYSIDWEEVKKEKAGKMDQYVVLGTRGVLQQRHLEAGLMFNMKAYKNNSVVLLGNMYMYMFTVFCSHDCTCTLGARCV